MATQGKKSTRINIKQGYTSIGSNEAIFSPAA
jgi:hypothetical protein